MTDRNITADLPADLVKPHKTIVFTETHGPRVTLCFDHGTHLPEHPAVERFHRLGWDHHWNRASMAQKRRGICHGNSGGTWVSMPLLAHEGAVEVATAVLTVWVHDDTDALDRLTQARVAALPAAADFRRGDDCNVRMPDGRVARVWSYPKRGPIQVRYHDGTAEEVEVLT